MTMSVNLEEALQHPTWVSHKRNVSLYTMDGLPDKWALVYYPTFQDGKTQEYYNEPRAIVQKVDEEGFWSKEIPLRYLELVIREENGTHRNQPNQ